MVHGYVHDWYLISGEGDCGEGDCGRVIVGRVNGNRPEPPQKFGLTQKLKIDECSKKAPPPPPLNSPPSGWMCEGY